MPVPGNSLRRLNSLQNVNVQWEAVRERVAELVQRFEGVCTRWHRGRFRPLASQVTSDSGCFHSLMLDISGSTRTFNSMHRNPGHKHCPRFKGSALRIVLHSVKRSQWHTVARRQRNSFAISRMPPF